MSSTRSNPAGEYRAPLSASSPTVGDAAVDGLLYGIAAGIVMVAILIMLGLMSGIGPSSTLSRFDARATSAPLMGALLHLAVSTVYGMMFAITLTLLGRVHRSVPGWLLGLLYGIILLVIAEIVLLPGTDSPLGEIPVLQFGIAHVAYGLVLGLMVGRGARRTE